MNYTCIADNQGELFGVGRSGDVNYWKAVAEEWKDNDEIVHKWLDGLDGKQVIDTIADLWQIEIVEDEDGSIAKRIETELKALRW